MDKLRMFIFQKHEVNTPLELNHRKELQICDNCLFLKENCIISLNFTTDVLCHKIMNENVIIKDTDYSSLFKVL